MNPNPDLFLPTSIPQLIDAVERCFDCEAGEPRAYTRDPPLMVGSDVVTSDWIEQRANLRRHALELQELPVARLIAKRLEANGVLLDDGPGVTYWKRDQEVKVDENGPLFVYFTLGFADEGQDPKPYVEAMWGQFKTLLKAARGSDLTRALPGVPQPRLIWRRKPRLDTYVADKELSGEPKDEFKTGMKISARLAVPALHGIGGALEPQYAQRLAIKAEGADAMRLPA